MTETQTSAVNGAATVIDAEVVEFTELESVAASTTLFKTDDPVDVLDRSRRVADALAPVILDRGLFHNIQGKKHITVEGWLTLGAMLGVTPVCVWTRPMDNGWEARVEARTLDGRVIGAAEAECLKSERRWGKADDYAVRSMAQTRATSKALGSVLRFIMTLAGYEGTPAEEMPASDPGPEPVAAPAPVPTISAEDAKSLVDRAWKVPEVKDKWALAISSQTGDDPGECKTKQQAIVAALALSVEQADALSARIAAKEAEANG